MGFDVEKHMKEAREWDELLNDSCEELVEKLFGKDENISHVEYTNHKDKKQILIELRT